MGSRYPRSELLDGRICPRSGSLDSSIQLQRIPFGQLDHAGCGHGPGGPQAATMACGAENDADRADVSLQSI